MTLFIRVHLRLSAAHNVFLGAAGEAVGPAPTMSPSKDSVSGVAGMTQVYSGLRGALQEKHSMPGMMATDERR